MLSLSVLPLSFLIIVSIWLSLICLSFSLLIGLWFFGVFVFRKVKSVEGVFSLMGVIVDPGGKSFGETSKLWCFSSINSIYFIRVFIPVDFIYSWDRRSVHSAGRVKCTPKSVYPSTTVEDMSTHANTHTRTRTREDSTLLSGMYYPIDVADTPRAVSNFLWITKLFFIF